MKRHFLLSVSLIAALALGAALPSSSESSSSNTIRLGTLKGPQASA